MAGQKKSYTMGQSQQKSLKHSSMKITHHKGKRSILAVERDETHSFSLDMVITSTPLTIPAKDYTNWKGMHVQKILTTSNTPLQMQEQSSSNPTSTTLLSQ